MCAQHVPHVAQGVLRVQKLQDVLVTWNRRMQLHLEERAGGEATEGRWRPNNSKYGSLAEGLLQLMFILELAFQKRLRTQSAPVLS